MPLPTLPWSDACLSALCMAKRAKLYLNHPAASHVGSCGSWPLYPPADDEESARSEGTSISSDEGLPLLRAAVYRRIARESFIATRRSLTRYRRPLGSSPTWAPSCIRRHRRWCQNWHQSDRPIHLRHSNGPMFIAVSHTGGVAERSNAAVLKPTALLAESTFFRSDRCTPTLGE